MLETPVAAFLLSTPLAAVLANETVRTWAVFILCWFFSIVGVGASFLVFGPNIAGYKLWGVSIVIAIAMISLSYGQKYATEASRNSFTPVDLISYLLQGFLWPSTWPTLATALGVSTSITGPKAPTPGSENLLHAAVSLFS